jgi:hypothetical protein
MMDDNGDCLQGVINEKYCDMTRCTMPPTRREYRLKNLHTMDMKLYIKKLQVVGQATVCRTSIGMHSKYFQDNHRKVSHEWASLVSERKGDTQSM